MKKSLQILLCFMTVLISSLAWAGEAGPSCEAVESCRAIVEVEVEIHDPSPNRYLNKKWSPELRHLQETAKTAVIVAVLKGDQALVGKSLLSVFFKGKPSSAQALELAERLFNPSSSFLSIPKWRDFFQATRLRLLFSIDRKNQASILKGWFVDEGVCHADLCDNYAALKTEVQRCMK